MRRGGNRRPRTEARAINQALQAALNPPGEHSVEKFGSAFSVGDKVMQIENNYDREVYNGDIGFVAEIDREEDELVAEFDGRLVRYPLGGLDELVLCYATTIHKSQGSEYPVVVIPLSTQHYMMLKRNLIYTGISLPLGMLMSVRSSVRKCVERRPMFFTSPVTPSTVITSPTRNGWSTAMATEPKRFSIVFCAPNASARPPMPSPARNVPMG